MKVNRAYRYELNPNKANYISFLKHAGVARFAFNWGLKKRIELYEREGKSTNAIAQHKELNTLKDTEFPWMYEVSKCAPQEALRNLDKAFASFFRGIKSGKKVGFPRFKRKGIRDSFRLTGAIKIKEKTVQLPRIGEVRLKEKTNIKGRVLSATVSREADRWFVSIHVEEERESPVCVQGEVTAIDVGLSCFGVFPCGKKLHAPKPLEKRLKRLKRASKKHSRKLKGSNNRRKSALTLARLHRKISNTRKDFLHKESTKLAKTKSVIVIEDLDIKGMLRNGNWNRQISDVGWGELRRMLEYKTEWYGSKLVVAPRYFPSSKRCSCCGYVANHLPLSIRNWQCTRCGTQHDRDVNAARNLMIWSTGSSPGIYACGDTSGGMSECLLAMHL